MIVTAQQSILLGELTTVAVKKQGLTSQMESQGHHLTIDPRQLHQTQLIGFTVIPIKAHHPKVSSSGVERDQHTGVPIGQL